MLTCDTTHVILAVMSSRSQGVPRFPYAYRDKPESPPDVRLAELATEQDGIVDRRQLRALGFDNASVHRRVRSGRLHRIHRGVYAVGHAALTFRARCRAAVMACGPRAVLSHIAAAVLHGYLSARSATPDVTVLTRGGRHHPGIAVHTTRRLHPHDVTHHHGIPITSPARTLLDLADVLTPTQLRRAVRQAQAERRVNVRQIAEVLARAQGRRGARALAQLIATGPAPTVSEAEDITLDFVLANGFRHPDVNKPLVVEGRVFKPDLRWPDQHLVVEIDSATWHDGALARGDDAERQALLEANGERVLRIFWEHAVTHPQRTAARLQTAGAPRASG